MQKISITPKALQRAAGTLRAIAHPARLAILEKLKAGKCSVGELVKALGLPQAVISKHLSLMKNTGLLACESDGNFRYYSLANTHVLEVLKCIQKSCPKEV